MTRPPQGLLQQRHVRSAFLFVARFPSLAYTGLAGSDFLEEQISPNKAFTEF